MQPCSPLKSIEGKDGKSLLENITANAAIYWDCSDRLDALVKAVK